VILLVRQLSFIIDLELASLAIAKKYYFANSSLNRYAQDSTSLKINGAMRD